MEENLLSALPTFKLYNNISVRLATFLGGPLAAGYLIAENFKELGEHSKIRMTWIISIVTTILICVIGVLLSKIKSFPNYIVPIIYTWTASYLVQHFQGDNIKLHIEEGGRFYSRWRAALVGIIALAILIVVFVAVFIIIGTPQA
jgi:hypothetical protein